MKITPKLKGFIWKAIREDLGAGDVTTRMFVTKKDRGTAVVLCKSSGIFAGQNFLERVFHSLDPNIRVQWYISDGGRVSKGKKLCRLSGSLASILKGERVALNFLAKLSGISTMTHRFVRQIRGTKAKIYDTRKTTPLWRDLEKYAVRIGGGQNHRMGLWDQALVKDNHWKLVCNAKEMARAVQKLRTKHCIVEIDRSQLKHLDLILSARPSVIMLDNFQPFKIRSIVNRIRKTNKRVAIEVSGRVTLANVRSIAKSGVDRISVGALTHSAPSLDLSLELTGSKSNT